MKPRRPAVKDSTHNIRSEGAKRRVQQVAAKAARKAAAKRARSEATANVPKPRLIELHFPNLQRTHSIARRFASYSALADDFRTFLLNSDIFELTLSAV